MGTRPIPFAPGEWFHCFTRGVDKRQIFMDENDSERFQMLLYTCNGTKAIHLSNLRHALRQGPALPHVLELDRGVRKVDIGAYCLMPNHLHLVMREVEYGGISSFMQKLGTSYTMYFNKKYERTGALFSGKFKAVHIETNAHFRRVFNYVHANPAELYEPGWKKGVVRNEAALKKRLCAYPYSSLPDYEDVGRPHAAIVNIAAPLESLHTKPSWATLLRDAEDFYQYEHESLDDLE